MEVGVRALPILTLITFFIGLILALQSAYELRKFGALNLGGQRRRAFHVARTRPVDHGHRGDWPVGLGICRGDRHDEGHRRNRRAGNDGDQAQSISWSLRNFWP